MIEPTDRSTPANEQHEGHADRHHRDVRRLGEDVAKIGERQEAVGQRRRRRRAGRRTAAAARSCRKSRAIRGDRRAYRPPLRQSHIAARISASRSKLRPVDEAANLAAAHDHDAVGHADQLLDLGGDEQHGRALGDQLVDDLVDLVLGADVDAARRLVEDEDRRSAQQPFGDHHLLLVAARKRDARPSGRASGRGYAPSPPFFGPDRRARSPG